MKWPFQRGWPLVRVASQKGFHCTNKLITTFQNKRFGITMETLLRSHSDKRSTPLERPFDNLILNMC